MSRDTEHSSGPCVFLPIRSSRFLNWVFSTTVWPILCTVPLSVVWKQRTTRTAVGDDDGNLATGLSLVVMKLAVGLCGLGMTIWSCVTVDVHLSANWSVVYCAKMTDAYWSTYKSYTQQCDSRTTATLRILEITRESDWFTWPSMPVEACILTAQH